MEKLRHQMVVDQIQRRGIKDKRVLKSNENSPTSFIC